jgi:ABC-2 type transport system ATP-binding protein
MNKILKVIDFKKNYKQNQGIIKPVSFSVTENSIHAILGLNGTGKTTIIKAIIGAIHNYKGSIEFSKEDIKIGYIPEKSIFPHNMSLFEYLLYMAYISGFKIKESIKIVNQKIIEYNLTDYYTVNPNKLSSGLKKKVLFLQAIIHDPDIIIMDEPIANLDPIAKKNFFNDSLKMIEQGKTIIITSHVLDEIDDYVTEVTLINKSEILFNGTSKKFKKNRKLSKALIEFIDKQESAVKPIGKKAGIDV